MMKLFTNEPMADKRRSEPKQDYSEAGSSINDRDELAFDLTKTNKSKNVSFAGKSSMKNGKRSTDKVRLSQSKINQTA